MKRLHLDWELQSMSPAIDGEYILYAEHIEAMKRIAGAPVAQGLTPEFLADAIPQTATIIYGEQEKAVRMNYDEIREFARAILAQSAPSASAPKDCHDDDDLHN